MIDITTLLELPFIITPLAIIMAALLVPYL